MPASASTCYLLIDAGNSAVKWALTRPGLTLEALHIALRDSPDRDEIFFAAGVFAHTLSKALPSPIDNMLSNAPNWGDLPEPASVWISNVAGEAVAQRLAQWVDQYWPGITQHRIHAQAQQCGVTNGYHRPQQLGSDRWASLIGAHAAYPGEAMLIATLGTATTLEALDASGRFIGGLIGPGAASALHALTQSAAQLPDPHTFPPLQPSASNSETPLPPSFFALDTVTALQEGQWLAQAGFIERGWQSVCAHFNIPPPSVSVQTPSPLRCLLSGGAAPQVAPRLTIPHTYHPHLVLQGLAVMAFESKAHHLPL